MFIDDVLAVKDSTYVPPQDELSKCFVVKVQNVWEFFKAHYYMKPFVIENYPNVAPPMDNMWFEWLCRDNIVHDVRNGEQFVSSYRLGVHVVSEDSGLRGLGDVRWRCMGVVYLQEVGAGVPPCYQGHVKWNVDSRGGVVDLVDVKIANMIAGQLEEVKRKDFASTLCQMVQPVWLSISFMHCKNVRVQQGPAVSEALQKARVKKGKLPLLRFHTVDIGVPMTERGDLKGGTSMEQGLHICRGHFKTFTSEKPLLGRHIGTYWWPMQVRGSSEYGVIDKDYEVKK